VSWFKIPVKKDENKKRFSHGKNKKGGVIDLMWIRGEDDSSSRLVVLLSDGLICGVGGL